MTDEQRYPVWDDLPPSVPAASRLYHLAPVGLGTSEGESLTSYLIRLAAAHHVSVQALILAEIRPHLPPEAARATERHRLPGFWRQGAATLNGVSASAQAWVTALQDLTARSDLEGLTMLRWRAVLSSSGLTRNTRRWCPCCYTEQRQHGGVVYDPLLWALEPVTWCQRHQRPLAMACLSCRSGQPLLAVHAQPGRCFRCGVWLGEALTETTPNEEQSETAWAASTSHAVGGLIAVVPTLTTTSPQRSQVMALVAALVGRMPWRSNAALARLLHTHDQVVGSWRYGHHLPQLEHLIRLCACVEQSPAELLTTADVAGMVRRAAMRECPVPSYIPRESYTRRDWNTICGELEAALVHEPPLSAGRLGRQLKVSLSQLRARFPDLYQALTTRYRTYAHARSQQRQQDFLATIRAAVLQVDQTGVYPDLKRVASLLPKSGMMRAPEARAAWRAMLEELGWEAQRRPSREENREA